MTSWHSYPKIHSTDHASVTDIFDGPVVIQEKYDGSQFSMGVINGELMCRSKGQVINIYDPPKLFTKAISTALALKDKLQPGWTYRAEYLMSRKHNTIEYSRHPKDHLMIFDINIDNEQYLSPEQCKIEAERLGLEYARVMYEGKIDDRTSIEAYLTEMSTLGGSVIEGIVIKNYNKFGRDGKALLAKLVNDSFKEKNNVEWKKNNPKSGDILTQLVQTYRSSARWEKAVQHLRDKGLLTDHPKDIALLVKEVREDLIIECKDEIIEFLWKWASDDLMRRVVGGIAEWYKDKLRENSI